MKKILLATAAAVLLSSPSVYAVAEEGTIYVKLNAGWDKLNAITAKVDSVNYGRGKSNSDAYLGLGVGYYVMDNARFELALDHLFNPTHKGSTTAQINPLPAAATAVSSKLKSKVDTLMLNGYMDLGNIDALKFYVGAGFGVVRNSAKLDSTTGNTAAVAKSKVRYNFAYAAHVGVSYELSPGITGELGYSYRVLGRASKFTKVSDVAAVNGTDAKIAAANYRGHFVGAGIRFDM